MAIVDSELQFFKSLVVTDDSSNGGVMSANLITTNQQQNVFPHVFADERTNGDTKHRKVFVKVSNDDDDTLFNPKIWLDNPTPGDDWVIFFAGTDIDTATSIAGTEAKFGCAPLQADASSGAGVITVTVEDTTLASGNDVLFRDTMVIGITNKATPDAVSGTIEFHVISGAPTPTVNDVQINLTGTLANSYTVAEGARVFGVYEPSDIVSSVDGYIDTTAGNGTFDDTNYPVLPDNIGSVDDEITVTFNSATTFTVAGARLGSLGAGGTSTNFSPTNADFTKPYFTIQSLAWTDTWASGDTLVFDLHPASVGIWEKRVVPAGASSLSGNYATLVMTGEAA